MKNLAVLCASLIVIPFLLGYLQKKFGRNAKSIVTYYRYFVFFNVIFTAIFLATRMIISGPNVASHMNWAYSPIFQFYAIAVLSMALLGLFTLFSQDRLMIAIAVCWSFFLILSSIFHIVEIVAQPSLIHSVMMVHIVYNLLVTLFLFYFIKKLNRYFSYEQKAEII